MADPSIFSVGETQPQDLAEEYPQRRQHSIEISTFGVATSLTVRPNLPDKVRLEAANALTEKRSHGFGSVTSKSFLGANALTAFGIAYDSPFTGAERLAADHKLALHLHTELTEQGLLVTPPAALPDLQP